MNTILLVKVKAAILANPEHFDMSLWACGTAACICGWTAKLAGEYGTLQEGLTADGEPCFDAVQLGARLLKISYEQASDLFLRSWPSDLYLEYENAGEDKAKRAQVAAAVIDDFIAHDGNWWGR